MKDASEVVLKTLGENRVEIRNIVIRPHAIGNDMAFYIFISRGSKIAIVFQSPKLIPNKDILIYIYFEIGS